MQPHVPNNSSVHICVNMISLLRHVNNLKLYQDAICDQIYHWRYIIIQYELGLFYKAILGRFHYGLLG